MNSSPPNLSFIGIVDFSQEAKWLYMTDSVTELLGFEPRDLINTPSLDLVHPDEFSRVRKLHHETITQDKAACLVYLRMKHKDPEKGYVLCAVSRTVVHNVLVGSVSFATQAKAFQNASTAQEITVIAPTASDLSFGRWGDPSPMPKSPIPANMLIVPDVPERPPNWGNRLPDPVSDSTPRTCLTLTTAAASRPSISSCALPKPSHRSHLLVSDLVNHDVPHDAPQSGLDLLSSVSVASMHLDDPVDPIPLEGAPSPTHTSVPITPSNQSPPQSPLTDTTASPIATYTSRVSRPERPLPLRYAPNSDDLITFEHLPSQSFRTAFVLDRFSIKCTINYCSNDLLISTTKAFGRSFYDFVKQDDEEKVRSWIDCVKSWGVNDSGQPSDGGFGFGKFVLWAKGRDSDTQRMPEPPSGSKRNSGTTRNKNPTARRSHRPKRGAAPSSPVHHITSPTPTNPSIYDAEQFVVDAIFSAHSDGLMVILRRASEDLPSS